MKRNAVRAPYLSALALVLGAATASAQTDMCVPAVGGLAGTPVIDGIVDGYTGPGAIDYDAGWNGATRWNLSGDLGATTASKLQAGLAGGFLYLSYVVDTPAYGQDNTILIGFAGTGAAASTDWRIHITPFDVAPPPDGAGQSPVSVTYWRNSATWNTGVAGTNDPAHWTYANTRFSKAGNRWAVEIRVPVTHTLASAAANTAVYLPATGAFRFYTVVLSTFGFVDPVTVVQDPWPAGVLIPGGDLLQNSTPASGSWGFASFNTRPACDGVSIAWSDIGVLAPPPAAPGTIGQQIRRFGGAIPEATLAACEALADTANPGSNGPNNDFVARPLNSMAADAPGVFATFRIATWGIPSVDDWAPLGAPPPFPGVSNNPTAQATIAAGTKGNLEADWALTYKQSCRFKFHPHQCIQVDLDSNNPSVRFLRKSVQKNMNFVPASTFQQAAHVSGNWSKVLGREADRFRMLILVDTDEQLTPGAAGDRTPRDPCAPPGFRHEELMAAAPAVQNAAQLAWVARGILVRDDTITINKTRYRIGTRVGDFGYIATHTGPFYGWSHTLEGQGLIASKQEPNTYMLDVTPGVGADLVTTIEAFERPQPGLPGDRGTYRVFFDLGRNMPTGALGDILDGGVSWNAGIERLLPNGFSIEGVIGRHAFDPDQRLWQFSGAVKRYVGTAPVHGFASAGGGLYRWEPAGESDMGVNVGAGVLYDLTPRVGIEGVYTFHAVNSDDRGSRFSTIQAGIRIRLP
jgi:hypothetical protein